MAALKEDTLMLAGFILGIASGASIALLLASIVAYRLTKAWERTYR